MPETRDGKRLVKDQTVQLDGYLFEDIYFENCELIYSGGIAPVLSACTIDQKSRLRFDQAAVNTLHFFAELFRSGLMTPFSLADMVSKNPHQSREDDLERY